MCDGLSSPKLWFLLALFGNKPKEEEEEKQNYDDYEEMNATLMMRTISMTKING